jgi:hypothetical protein
MTGVADHIADIAGNERTPPTWRNPPLATVLVAILLIAAAEAGGASMVRFKVELARWARSVMLARPATHGLLGVRDVDEQVLDEALVTFDGGLRLFHMHAEGMGLVIIGATTVAVTFVRGTMPRRVIVLLLTVGGAGYPLGYLFWSGLIPYVGIERGKTLAEWLFWMPFGGATIVATWWLAALLAWRMVPR